MARTAYELLSTHAYQLVRPQIISTVEIPGMLPQPWHRLNPHLGLQHGAIDMPSRMRGLGKHATLRVEGEFG